MKTLKTLAFITALGIGSIAFAQRPIHLNPCAIPTEVDTFAATGTWVTVDPITSGNGSIVINTPGKNILISNLEGGSSACAASGQTGAASNREMRVYRPLGSTLGSTWRAEFTIRIDNGNAPNHGLLGFTSGTVDPEGNYIPSSGWTCGSGSANTGVWTPSNQDGIFASLVAFGSSQVPSTFSDQPFNVAHQAYSSNTITGWCIYGHAKKGPGSFYPATTPFNGPQLNWSWGIPLPHVKINYYLRLERINPGECMISVFSDAARTVHVPGSPQCFQVDPSISGLNTMQDFTHQSGSFLRTLTGNVSNFALYSGCPAIPTLTLTASSASVCAGQSATLTATPGFQTYTWMPGNIGTTTNTLLVSPSVNTTYSVYATYNGYPCQILSSTVTVNIDHTNYTNFNPDFSISATLPAGGTSFSVVATPITGSQNTDIYSAGAGYGYLWSVDMIDPATNNVLCTISNPSNWWSTAANNYFPGYSSNTSPSCSNSGSASGNGWFDMSYKYRFTRGIWNPCTYSSISKTVSMCTNCKTADGKPRLIVESGTEETVPNTHTQAGNKAPSRTIPVEQADELIVAPNPHSGQFTLYVNNHDAAYTYAIYDVMGHLVVSGTSKDAKQPVTMPDGSKGIYIIKVNVDGTMLTKRMMQE